MGSLLSIIRKCGIRDRSEILSSIAGLSPRELALRIIHHDTIHVEAKELMDEVLSCPAGIDWRRDLEDVTPPFEFMWVELAFKGHRFAVLMQRLEVLGGAALALNSR